jgi:hypothetical protein
MPAPSANTLSQTAKMIFSGKGIRLPVNWQDMGPVYPQAFTPAERAAQANPPGSLFHASTLNKYHTDAARTLGRAMEQFIDDMSAALSDAIGKWMRTAAVVSVTINGPIGTLLPGGVTGPMLKPLIMARAPVKTEMDHKYSHAVAEAVSSGWASWQQGLSGMLSYPSFAASPTPAAPPTPNVPAPLVTFGSSGESALAPGPLKEAMAAALGQDGQHAGTLFEAIAGSFYTHFQTFKLSTLVSGVLGAGPVAMPPGPVAGGAVMPTPGNFV